MRILFVGYDSCLQKVIYIIGSFDAPVHISEEASNAATAVPWAIVWATSIGGIFGLGTPSIILACVDNRLVQISATQR